MKPTPTQQEQVSNMKIGEIWYVRVDDNLLLDKKRISDLTVRTVEIETLDYFPRSYRYERKDVVFVEKVK